MVGNQLLQPGLALAANGGFLRLLALGNVLVTERGELVAIDHSVQLLCEPEPSDEEKRLHHDMAVSQVESVVRGALTHWWVLPPIMRAVPMGVPIASAAYTAWARHRLRITGRPRELGEGSACTRSKA